VTGTEKALAFGLNPFVAAILGMITCIGGGVARDLLTLADARPCSAELYAVAALAGAGSMSLGLRSACPPCPVMLRGGLCLFLRLMSIYGAGGCPPLVGKLSPAKETDLIFIRGSAPSVATPLAGPVDER
jgi:uncharacterized membrane protein YeiH